MSKYVRNQIFANEQVVDPDNIDLEFASAMGVYNGAIDALQLDDGICNTTNMQAQCCNRYSIIATLFGSGGAVIERSEINSRDWYMPDSASVTFTAEDDGVIVGQLDFSIRTYAQNVSTVTIGWAVGMFLDGTLVGRTDRITVQTYSGGLPIHAIVTKGSHTLRLGLLAYAYPASLAADPNDVMQVFDTLLWYRLAKR